jgi:hypothetical protein
LKIASFFWRIKKRDEFGKCCDEKRVVQSGHGEFLRLDDEKPGDTLLAFILNICEVALNRIDENIGI